MYPSAFQLTHIQYALDSFSSAFTKITLFVVFFANITPIYICGLQTAVRKYKGCTLLLTIPLRFCNCKNMSVILPDLLSCFVCYVTAFRGFKAATGE
jgi:hypothetical protein